MAPWQRVVNAQAQISMGGVLERRVIQLQRLTAEDVRFERYGSCQLEALRRWPPEIVAD